MNVARSARRRLRLVLPRWVNPTDTARHLSDSDDKRTQIYRAIERTGFDVQVFLVAATGFFTDSYNLFATNVILPAIAYVYWPEANDDDYVNWESAIICVTLGGTAIGQLLFGYLADRYGRRKLYGLELIIVIVSTLGITQASSGYIDPETGQTSMSIQAWLLFYRLMQGIGIGGEYPMSAVICAEFASVKSRARMMASVFLMQPLGALSAAVIGLIAVYGLASHNTDNSFGPTMPSDSGPPYDPAQLSQLHQSQVHVDKVWRWVIGVGAVPAAFAILFRLTIPESPRYTLDVDKDTSRALRDTLAHYGSQPSFTTQGSHVSGSGVELAAMHEDNRQNSFPSQSYEADGVSPGASRGSSGLGDNRPQREATVEDVAFFTGLREYLATDGNWRWLAGTSICWFLLDFAYYGLGLNNAKTLAKIWEAHAQPANPTNPTSWDTNVVTGDPNSLFSMDGHNIFYVLRNDALRSIITTSIGAVIGSILMIQMIPYLPRKAMLTWTFVILFVLLTVTGGSFFSVFQTDAHAVTITLYVLIQLVFNLGPNTLIFIYPAEIFKTQYRGTCYGIASASGKISAVLVSGVLPNARFGDGYFGDSNSKTPLGALLCIWGGIMLLGASVAWVWLPDVQKPRGEDGVDGYKIPSKTLEELAKGRVAENHEDNYFEKRVRRRQVTAVNGQERHDDNVVRPVTGT